MSTLFRRAPLAVLCLALPAFAQQDRWQKSIDDGLHALATYAHAGAEQHFRTALDEAQGLGPLQVAQSSIYLGLVYERQDQFDRADPLYARALALREKELGPDHPDVASALEHCARIVRKLGQQTEADAAATRARDIRERAIREKWRAETKPEASRVGGGTTAPRLLQRIEPEYCEEARVFRHDGVVELSIQVWPDGRAHNIDIRHGLGLGLDEKAAEAVSRWRFEPGTWDGRPITVGALVTVHFRLL